MNKKAADVKCHFKTGVLRSGQTVLQRGGFLFLTLAILLVFLFALPVVTLAKEQGKKAPLSLTTKGFLIVTEELNGKTTEKITPLPDKIPPNSLVQYEITGKNSSTKHLNNIETVGQIPENTEYVDKSATCDKAVELFFSYDKGATFAKPPLKKTVTGPAGEKKVEDVSPLEYTNIKFLVKKLDPKAGFKAVYRVTVK